MVKIYSWVQSSMNILIWDIVEYLTMDLKSWMIIPQRYNLYKIRNPQCPLFKWSHIKRKLKLISKAVKNKVCVQGRYFKGAGNILHKVTLFRYQPILYLILHSNEPVKKSPLFPWPTGRCHINFYIFYNKHRYSITFKHALFWSLIILPTALLTLQNVLLLLFWV